MATRKLGIDVSKWQKSGVDYKKAKEEGVEFVFIRIGYNKTKDPYFEADYAKAIAAGLKVGVYHYTISTKESEGGSDATRVLGWLNGRHLDFPVGYDIEDAKQKSSSRRAVNSAMYESFRSVIEKDGHYDAILYTGEFFYNNYFDKSKVTDDLWIAKYSNTSPSVGRQVSIWQFSSAPINTSYWNGKLDRNYMLVDHFQGSRNDNTGNIYPIPSRLIKRTYPMMKGDDVRWIQYELGYRGAKLDGKYGDGTKSDVIVYQKAHGLVADGKVGPATRYAMAND